MAYKIRYSDIAKEDMRFLLTARQQAEVIDKVIEQLSYEPTKETRSRKRMDPNPLGLSWALRIGNLRVYYEVQEQPEAMVKIERVGIKERNRTHLKDTWLEPRSGKED